MFKPGDDRTEIGFCHHIEIVCDVGRKLRRIRHDICRSAGQPAFVAGGEGEFITALNNFVTGIKVSPGKAIARRGDSDDIIRLTFCRQQRRDLFFGFTGFDGI
ncbi:hypothetical protein D3C72_1043340 [compost metagenome]